VLDPVAYPWLQLASLGLAALRVACFLNSFLPFLPSFLASFHLLSFRLALAWLGSAWLHSAQLGSASLGFIRLGFTLLSLARLGMASSFWKAVFAPSNVAGFCIFDQFFKVFFVRVQFLI